MKKIYLLFMCMLTTLVMTASQFSQEQAKHAAHQFLKQKVGTSATIGSAQVVPIMQAQPKAANANSQMAAYAVNLGNDKGFVLVGGNDQAQDIIGYCDHGTLDVNNMPANMRAWLDSYLACAAGADAQSILSAAAHHPTKTPIAPLLTCQWNQNSPFNDQCPVVNDMHCATGCTNTAMAQVMFHHKWPKAATQAIPAYTPDNSAGTSYPALPALESTTFDWSKIYPTYKNGEDGTEVARLLQYLGTASHTLYGEQSSATGYNALQALIKYFDYDAGGKAVWRSQCDYYEWIDMLYAELQANRPVMFSGSAADAAHSFVVDGYDEDDYFHVNWGWGGTSDGYFKVVLMNPKVQGIGGSMSNDAFSFDQVAFFGVQPNAGGVAMPIRLSVLKNWLLCDAQGDYTYDTPGNQSTSPYFDKEGYLVYAVMDCHNYTSVTGEFELGCRLVKDDGSVTKDILWGVSSNFIPNASLYNQKKDMHIDPVADPSLTDGDYKMYFISKLKTDDTWQLVEGSENHYMVIHLDDAHKNLTATAVSNDAKLSLEYIKFNPTTPVVGKDCEVTIKVKNNGTGSYHGNLGISVTTRWLDAVACDIEPGETIELHLSFKPKEAGDLAYMIQDRINVLYNGTVTVVNNNQTSNCDLTITHQVTNAVGNEIAAPKAKIDLTITNNSDNNYFGGIYIYCFKYIGDEGNVEHVMYPEAIPAHQTVVLHRESPELTGGELYRFSTMYIKNGAEIEQEIPEVYYTTAPYYYTYDADGNESTKRATATLQPDATECAIDLTVAPEVTSVNTSSNPNLIIIASENSPLTGDNIVKGDQAENVKLSDGYPFYSPIPFTANHISYTRTPERYFDIKSNKGWSTIVLPFAATSCQATIDGVATPLNWYTSTNNGEIMLATFKYENGSNMEFSLPESTLTACHPYLLGIPSALSDGRSLANVPITFSADNAKVVIKGESVTGRDYKMSGTFSPIMNEDNIYVLNAEGSAFVNGAQTVNPFQAYFVPFGARNPADKLTIIFNIETTAISDIIDDKPNDQPAVYYNLNGQRVTHPDKGIYIVNGKKVIIK